MRVLTLDIETRPSVVHSWALWNQTHGLNQVVEPGRVICFAAKWLDKKGVMFFSEYDEGGLRGMAEAAHRLLSEADVVVTYNGVGFDIKHLHALMVEHGLTPPVPHKDVDLLRIVKKRFRFLSNKLQHVSERLDLGSKLQHGGHELWTGWMNGDEKSIRTMTRYCRQDVRLTEDLFTHLRDLNWLPAGTIPSVATLNQTAGRVCAYCASTDLVKNGMQYTAAGQYQKYLCHDCGRSSSDRTRTFATTLKGI